MGASARQANVAMRDAGTDSTLLATTGGDPLAASGEVLVERGFLDRFYRSPDLEAIARQLIDGSTVVHVHGLWSYMNLVVPGIARGAGAPLGITRTACSSPGH